MMTREDAIVFIKGCLTDYLPKDDYWKLEEVLQALEQPECEDAVSRKALKNIVEDFREFINDLNDYTPIPRDDYKGYMEYLDDINNLPSVTPKQRWIPVTERLPEDAYGCLVTVHYDDYYTGEHDAVYREAVGWDGETWNDRSGLPIDYEVIAWMPQPKPYLKGGQDG